MEQQVFNNINYRFFIRGTKPSKPYTLYIRIRNVGTPILASCGVKVYKDQWCQRKQRAYISPLLSEIDNHNNEIVNRTIEEYIKNLHNLTNEDGFLNNLNISLRCMLVDYLNSKTLTTNNKMKQKTNNEIDIFKYLKDSAINDGNIAEETQKNYGRGIERFREFTIWWAKQGHTPITSFKDVNSLLIEEFHDYLCRIAKTPKGDKLTITTINSSMKYFITAFHKYAYKSRTVSKEETSRVDATYSKNKSDVAHIALRDDELTKLLKYKCDNPNDEEIKDMFLMLCLTGQRVGDINKISDGCDSTKGFEKISIVQSKGQNLIDAPIVFEAAVKILNKYNHQLPKITEKQINQNINRIAAAAGIGCDEYEKSSQHYEVKPLLEPFLNVGVIALRATLGEELSVPYLH